MTNWPDPARPGVPLNSERDGWHIVNGGPRLWDAYNQHWKWNDGIEVYRAGPEQAARQGWGYKGPLLVVTPAEVAAQVEAARREGAEAMREAAAHAAYAAASTSEAGFIAVDLIRALPLPGDDA